MLNELIELISDDEREEKKTDLYRIAERPQVCSWQLHGLYITSLWGKTL